MWKQLGSMGINNFSTAYNEYYPLVMTKLPSSSRMDGGARELGLCGPGGIQIWHEETGSLGENESLGGCLVVVFVAIELAWGTVQ